MGEEATNARGLARKMKKSPGPFSMHAGRTHPVTTATGALGPSDHGKRTTTQGPDCFHTRHPSDRFRELGYNPCGGRRISPSLRWRKPSSLESDSYFVIMPGQRVSLLPTPRFWRFRNTPLGGGHDEIPRPPQGHCLTIQKVYPVSGEGKDFYGPSALSPKKLQIWFFGRKFKKSFAFVAG